MFVDIVANGGNLLLIVNLDGQGALPSVQEKRLKDIGSWLKINGEGIYGTRKYSSVAEGNVVYTCSKDKQYVYAIMKEWPGRELHLRKVCAEKGSEIRLLGYDKPLKWVDSKGEVIIKLPDNLKDESNRPCANAWVLKIKL